MTSIDRRRASGKWSAVLFVVLGLGLGSALPAPASDLPTTWKHVEDRVDEGAPISIFVEIEKTPGRPAFKIETHFDVEPEAAAQTLMHAMLDESTVPSGQQRKILEHGDRKAIVYTFVDLPFMLADREIAVRIVHSDDPKTGVHRIEWNEANEVLPAGDEDVVRLTATQGYWEFRPHGAQQTNATYVNQAEIGGSIPMSIGDHLMEGQAVDAVAQLRRSIQDRQGTHVASGPPATSESETSEAD